MWVAMAVPHVALLVAMRFIVFRTVQHMILCMFITLLLLQLMLVSMACMAVLMVRMATLVLARA